MLLTVPAAVLAIAIAALLWAATHDLLARTIPDLAPTIVAVSGLALRFADGTVGIACCAAGLLFAFSALCWRAGWLGGGDAKLLTAVAFLLPPGQLLPALVAVAESGAVLALPYLVARGRLPRPAPDRPATLGARAWRAELFRLRRGGPLPYGVAIAAGVLLSLLGPTT
ncbi:MAG: prepilin peptidase [Acetobacteraceae bacterium]|nr:prepilin peptidase [Acetobacteraceae bacterium]